MDYTGALSLAAATATNLLTLLIAAGFVRTALADEVEIVAGAAAITIGSSAATAPTGRPVAINAAFLERAAKRGIDLKSIWLYCPSATTITVNIRGI